VRLRNLVNENRIRGNASHVGQEIVCLLQTVGIRHIERIEEPSFSRHADGRLLAEALAVRLYAEDMRHVLRVIHRHEISNRLTVLHRRGKDKVYRLGVVHRNGQTLNRAYLCCCRHCGQQYEYTQIKCFHFK